MSRPREYSPFSGRAPGPCCLRERGPQPVEGSMQSLRPRPGLVEAQDEPATTAHEQCRHMQDAVAERFRLCLFQLPVETRHLRPGEESTCDQAGGHPGEVLGKGCERQVLQPAVLPVAYPGLHPRMPAESALAGRG